jgi:hypothetical protein
VHIDIKHLPKLRTADGERRKRYLYVAIDRRSRSVHLAVKDDETEKSAIAFLREAAAAFPFRLTHVLTDNGSCFTPAFARVCHELGAEYRHTKPYSPHTNGMVERFNGRVGSEVLGITIHSHAQLERLLRGFNAAYNARRQRVLDGKTPDQVVAERLKARRKLANPKPHGARARGHRPGPPHRRGRQRRSHNGQSRSVGVVWLDAEGDGCGLIAGHDDQEDEQAASWRDGSGKERRPCAGTRGASRRRSAAA